MKVKRISRIKLFIISFLPAISIFLGYTLHSLFITYIAGIILAVCVQWVYTETKKEAHIHAGRKGREDKKSNKKNTR